MKTNSEIRQESLSILKGNWASGVGVTLLLFVVITLCSALTASIGLGSAEAGAAETIIGSISELLNLLVAIFIFYPLAMSMVIMFLSFVKSGEKLSAKGLTLGFKSPLYSKSVVLYLLIAIYTFLWSLLLIVPGIIKSLSYALAPYILAENPELKANEAIEKSMAMMAAVNKLRTTQLWYHFSGNRLVFFFVIDDLFQFNPTNIRNSLKWGVWMPGLYKRSRGRSY